MNLLPHGVTAQGLMNVYRNTSQREERFCGDGRSGFANKNGIHSFPNFCPHMLCLTIKQQLRSYQVASLTSSDILSLSPMSPSTTRETIQNLRAINDHLKRSLLVETERSEALVSQLKSKELEIDDFLPKFLCEICEKPFTRPDTLSRHVITIHPEANVPNPKDVGVTCKDCGKVIKTRHLVKHRKIYCCGFFKKPSKDPRGGYCHFCGKTVTKLEEHQARAHALLLR